VEALALAIETGGGTMAQFSHSELGGSVQWMAGGMTMVGDMFNNALKAKVEAIAQQIAAAMRSGREIFERPVTPAPGIMTMSQSSSGGWWPAELGSPASTGAQNTTRYAYFPDKRRLVIDEAGKTSTYDTLDHRIGGFGQQQGSASGVAFTSQHGTVSLSSLPLVSGQKPTPVSANSAPPAAATAKASSDDITVTLERLKELADKGVITAEEFTAKKKELLARI